MASSTPNKSSLPLKRVVLSETQQVVDEVLEAAANDPFSLMGDFCKLHNVWDQFGEDRVMSAFVIALDRHESVERIYAAAIIRLYAEDSPNGCLKQEVVARATKILVDSLHHEDSDLKIAACYLVSLSKAPAEAEPWLKSLMRDPDECVRIFAAAARATIIPKNKRVLDVLYRGLRSERNAVALISARGLLNAHATHPDVVERIISILQKADVDLQYSMLTVIKQQGNKAVVFSDAIRRLIGDTTERSGVRAYACSVLGWITKGTGASADVLLQALNSEDHDLIQGAVTGFLEAGHVPDDALDRLASLLSAEEEDLRVAAFYGIKSMGLRASSVAAALVERVDSETSTRGVESLAEAIASIGERAIPHIVKRLRDYDWKTLPTLALSLSYMGVPAAKAIARLLETETDVYVCAILIQIVRDMPDDAVSEVVPALSMVLDKTNNGAVAMLVVTAIASAGDAASAALPALIRCLMVADDELAGHVESVLRRIGQAAVLPLTEALAQADETDRPRLARALAGLWAPDGGKYEVYAALGNDEAWRAFLFVASLLSEEPMSFSAMSAEYKRRLDFAATLDSLHRPRKDSASDRHLLNMVERVERHLNRELVIRVRGKPSRLAPDTEHVVTDVREYLARRGALAGDPMLDR